MNDRIRTQLNLTTADATLIQRSLILFAQTHERDHSCADATRARVTATDLEPFTTEEDASPTLAPGWYLDDAGDPVKVWSDGMTHWYANEGDKAADLPPSVTRLLPLTVSDWERVRAALDVAYWAARPEDRDERLHAIAGRMADRRNR